MKKWVLNLGAAVMLALVTACGGGGGSDTTAVTPPVVNPPGASVNCPDGTAAASADKCALVTASFSIQSGATVDLNSVNNGVVVTFSGAMQQSPGTIDFSQGSGLLFGFPHWNSTNTAFTWVPSVRAGFGQTDKLSGDLNDKLGRPVHFEVPFTTSAMSCTNNAVWSNPASYSTAAQDCVAPVGVQVVLDSVNNKMQDASCTFTVGAAVTADCQKYAANGTLTLADTSIVVANDPVVWVAYYGQNGASNLVLVDKTTFKVVGSMQLPGTLTWYYGNPTGAAVHVDGVTHQVGWNGSALQFNN